ncbi:nucleoside triphosphate pyrophosphohydrolase [Bacillus sp. H-16]|uniref:nucleoside triphosphate pyrophosphohydrolase n=1 Tax=Alteribacter salitolerans TaxID=2912333 RepID=UPI001966A7FB|nr:nucleoside triphosphate pyrophosphohydrolase [Alteribacter salitolerans]MBM7095154.1 nucleoside triphosphate pyrophosphohydrolase [Alteribacter salitolerans]
MPVYNKLVRDRIPEVIEQSGKKAVWETLTDKQYLSCAKEKMKEELEEYLAAENDEEAVEELADLLELIYCLAKQHNSTVDQLEVVRREKAEKRGSFKEKVFLREVIE